MEGPREAKEVGQESVLDLTLAAPSIVGTLKSLSFSHRLLATSAGPTFSTTLRDKSPRLLVHLRSLCVHEGV